MHDLLLRNALIVDGTGAPARGGDIAIDGGCVSAIGNLEGTSARRTIDLDGLALAPGFIDLHSHADFTLPSFPDARSAIHQGVTTLVGGNCGFSPFPLSRSHGEAFRAYCEFIDRGLRWDWTDAAGYRDALSQLRMTCNVALQVGHGAVRAAVMGFDLRPASPDEIREMVRHVATAFAQGCIGFSTGLFYPPGAAAQRAEIVALASVAAAAGGYYSTHIRDEGDYFAEAVEEAIDVATMARVPLHLSHHKALGRWNWGKVRQTLGQIDRARAQGLDVTADVYPYTAGATTLLASFPAWAVDGGIPAMRERLTNQEIRARLRSELVQPDNSLEPGRRFDPDSIVLSSIPEGPNKRYEGMSLSDVARLRGTDPIDVAFEIAASDGGAVSVIQFAIDESDVRAVIRHPAVAVASDSAVMDPSAGGIPHPRTYGTFVRVLGRYVRQDGVLTLEEAVRKMTSLCAGRLGLADRGVIRMRARGDLVAFDPRTIIDAATYTSPHQLAQGVHHVLVDGRFVIEDGFDTGDRAGRVLTGPTRPRANTTDRPTLVDH